MKYVICDIDGTLTKVGDRIKCLEQSPKDWDSFYARCGEDDPNFNILKIIWELERNPFIRILYCTGRRKSCSDDTKSWLQTYCAFHHVIYRPDGDHRHDTEVKPEMLANYMNTMGISADDVLFILEDRNSMVKKWRELGYTCLQVSEGDF